MHNKKAILVVEDEIHIAELLEMNMQLEGYRTFVTDSAVECISIIQKRKIDLVILDVMLPDGNGIDVCRKIKNLRSEIPVLILSALGQSSDRIKGLKSGADDYLAKPFNLEELLIRISKLINRYSDATNYSDRRDVISIGEAQVNLNKSCITRDGKEYHLTLKEAELLKYMIEKKNTLLSRQLILEEVWGYEQYPNTRTIDNFISNLRKYLEPDLNQAIYIRTVRGKGYMLAI
jgi:two-component system alkaline phosphatase synthesis response regulator PhoP